MRNNSIMQRDGRNGKTLLYMWLNVFAWIHNSCPCLCVYTNIQTFHNWQIIFYLVDSCYTRTTTNNIYIFNHSVNVFRVILWCIHTVFVKNNVFSMLTLNYMCISNFRPSVLFLLYDVCTRILHHNNNVFYPLIRFYTYSWGDSYSFKPRKF